MSTDHHVCVHIKHDASHVEVQGRVLVAVVKAFEDRAGPVCVTGFDLAKQEKEMGVLRDERDAYRKAWLKDKKKLEALEAEQIAKKKKKKKMKEA